MSDLVERLARVQGRIDAACAAAGRDPRDVRLLPVTKTHGADAVRAVVAAGYATVGENKVQEAAAKASELADLAGVRWALIGHLQRNKVAQALRFADEFQALDSLRLASELDRRLQADGRRLPVLIQVNSSGEASKFGLAPAEVPAFARELKALDALDVRGLMTLALPSPDRDAVASCFDRVVAVQRALRDDDALDGDYAELSMGMSGDFELAIAHGATCVRVGTAIFGARPPASPPHADQR